MGSLQARFDWYEATFEDLDPEGVAVAIAKRLGGSVAVQKGRNGYALCAVVQADDRVIARVLYRSKRVAEVHVEVTGEACDDVVPIIRKLWSVHKVSRCDVALDFAADFDQLDVLVLAFAEGRGLKHRLFTNSDGGATRYVGARGSETSMRVYKKSEELRAMYPQQAHEVPDGIVRVELIVKVHSKMKGRLCSMEPGAMFGLSKWGRAFALEFLKVDAERVPTHFREITDWTRLVGQLVYQYGPAIQRRVSEVGREQVREELLEMFELDQGGVGDSDDPDLWLERAQAVMNARISA
jgi:hypothetical protein